MSAKYQDPEWLREKYIGEEMSQMEMAEEIGVNQTTISKWLLKNGIETRGPDGPDTGYVPIEIKSDGYVRWRCKHKGERWDVRVHRLLAVAEFGFDAVADNVVHHKNGHRWDNRPGNIEIMTHSEHMKHHYENGDTLPHRGDN